jgi:NADH:ubiquinone oxidoreductase subunit F (NADH-binding)
MSSATTAASTDVAGSAPPGLPRLLRYRPQSLDEHVGFNGPLPRLRGDEVIDLVARAGLRGRGGASFPTAIKLRAVAAGRRPVVVANGCEGEPASMKDVLLLTEAPHLVLDGLALAASAVGAREAVIATERVQTEVIETLARSIGERAIAGVDKVPVRLVGVPPRYLAGEESALVHFLNGGEAKPTTVPPRPFERGVRGRPTLVQNVETLAHIALIARHGDEWFRALGSADEPGSALFSVSGAVGHVGVYEAALGTPLSALLNDAGAVPTSVSAVLVGGYFGTWLPVERIGSLSLSNESLRAAGAALGCGVVVALPATSCGVRETARVVRYLAEESAGQCGPCVHGLSAVAGAMDALARGHHVRRAKDDLTRWLRMIPGRGACRHPDGAMRFVASALSTFSAEITRHGNGNCSAITSAAVLPVWSSAQRDGIWR